MQNWHRVHPSGEHLFKICFLKNSEPGTMLLQSLLNMYRRSLRSNGTRFGKGSNINFNVLCLKMGIFMVVVLFSVRKRGKVVNLDGSARILPDDSWATCGYRCVEVWNGVAFSLF